MKIRAEEQLNMLESGEANLDDIPNLTKQRQDDNITKKSLYEPRNIDLDILFYGDVIIKGMNLVVPHPRLHERLFVLEPMAEIAPDFMHPIFKKTVKELLAKCKEKDEADTQ
ncbi:MAG: 2-amino-4-hydroxy-6-hydroxymethyldihydropteridine diphosphokinase [Candidatus Omnitrophota bacterium]